MKISDVFRTVGRNRFASSVVASVIIFGLSSSAAAFFISVPVVYAGLLAAEVHFENHQKLTNG